jgi:hypothetical protein
VTGLRVTGCGLGVSGFGLRVNGINIRIDVTSVGAAFQPRLNDYGVRATSSRGWKATPTSS